MTPIPKKPTKKQIDNLIDVAVELTPPMVNPLIDSNILLEDEN